MAINLGSTVITHVKLGSSQVSKIYLGVDQVWPVGSISISPSSTTIGHCSGSLTVTIRATAAWTLSDNVTWLSLALGQSATGTGNASRTYNYTTNTGAARTGIITVTLDVGGESDTTTVNQLAVASTTAVTLATSTTSGAAACSSYSGGSTATYYIPVGQVFSTATHLYTDSTGCTLAASGWYSDGGIYREWDGSTFVGTNGNCTV